MNFYKDRFGKERLITLPPPANILLFAKKFVFPKSRGICIKASGLVHILVAYRQVTFRIISFIPIHQKPLK